MIGHQAKLLDPTAILFRSTVRPQVWGYLGAELAWYLEGDNSLESIQAYAPKYDRFSDDGYTLYGAYGMRGLSQSSIANQVSMMRDNPTSRQFVIPIWRLGDRTAKTKDMPCTVAMQFLIRNNLVHCIVYMRSNDLGIGFIYDIPCFCLIQQMVASSLGLGVGTYTHNTGSIHVYDRDVDRLKRAISSPISSHRWADFDYTDANWLRSTFRRLRTGLPSNPATRAVVQDMERLYDHHRGRGLHGQDDTGQTDLGTPKDSGAGNGDPTPFPPPDGP